MKDNKLGIRLNKNFLYNILTSLLNRYISRLNFDLWLNINNLYLYRVISLEYIKEIFNVNYKIENYIIIRLSAKFRIRL